jgi:hypothetical protein
MWSLILKVVSGFIRAYWKWILLALLVIFAYFKVTSMWENYKEGVEAKASALRIEALKSQASSIEAQRARAAIQQLEANRERMTALMLELREEQKRIKNDTEDRLDAFTRADDTKHDLAKAANRHGQWVAKLATNASNEILQEIEDEINN